MTRGTVVAGGVADFEAVAASLAFGPTQGKNPWGAMRTAEMAILPNSPKSRQALKTFQLGQDGVAVRSMSVSFNAVFSY
jgi:hypothetical protein